MQPAARSHIGHRPVWLLDQRRCRPLQTQSDDETTEGFSDKQTKDPVEMERREMRNCSDLLEAQIVGEVLFYEVDRNIDTLCVQRSMQV